MKQLIIAIKMFVVMSLITGILYPLSVTIFAQLFFSEKANGSLIYEAKKCYGSELIGQQFVKPEYFWGRPSAIGNNPVPSGGSNLSPLGTKFKEQVTINSNIIRKYHGNIEIGSIPRDLLFSSGSGVDPHISPDAALFQIGRIVKYRHFSELQTEKLKELVKKSIEGPDWFILGEYRVNVLKLNLQLDGI